jgi:hypothetical protein
MAIIRVLPAGTDPSHVAGASAPGAAHSHPASRGGKPPSMK